MNLKNTLLLAVFIIFLPAMAEAQLRTVRFTWEDPQNVYISGYRIYHQDLLICQIDDPAATSADCSVDAADGETWFTITSYIENGPESRPSGVFTYHFAPDLPDLTAQIAAETTGGNAPLVATFDASSSTGDIVSYQWDFGDGDTATGAQVNHTFLAAGNYTVRLRVTDSGGAFAQKDLSITVTEPAAQNSPPTAVLSSSSSVGESPLQVSFDGSGSTDSDGTILSYNWTFGDGGQATGATVAYTYTTPGTYQATLTVIDDGGLTNSASTPVLVQHPTTTNKRPVAVIKISSKKGTLPLRISLDGGDSYDEDGRIVSYNWNFGDGSTASGRNVKHTFTQTADYTISLTVTDDFGAKSQPSTITVKVQESLPQPVQEAEQDIPNILPIINFLLIQSGDGDPEESGE
jgi:PKD repeat protein